MADDPLLRDLTVYDTEGTRWAVIQRWLKDIVDTINTGGGGGGTGRDFTTMVVVGTAQLNSFFGFFKAPSSIKWSRAQLFCQTAPVGAALTVTFVDASGTSLGVTASIPDGQNYAETVFGSILTLNAGDVVRCKVTGVGSTTNGGYVTVNLM